MRMAFEYFFHRLQNALRLLGPSIRPQAYREKLLAAIETNKNVENKAFQIYEDNFQSFHEHCEDEFVNIER